MDEVREFLDTKYDMEYMVYNLTNHEYNTAKLHGQVSNGLDI